MLFYFTVITVASFCAGIANTQKYYNRYFSRFFFILSSIIMFVPLAMRDVGVDYDQYIISYLRTATDWSVYWSNYILSPEPLYVVLNYMARGIFGSFQGVNFLCAILSIGFTFAGIYRFKDKVNLGTAVWCFGFLYYLMMYGLNRMMISVAIITWAWQYYFSRKPKTFIIWAIIAGLFHYAALLMIPFYFVLKWMESRKFSIHNIKWFRVIISVTLILVVIYRVVPTVFGGYYWFARYRGYFELSFTLSALNNNAATYLLILLVIIFRRVLTEYLDEYKPMISMIILYTVLSLACVIMPIHRITYYFYPICILLYGAIPAAGVLSTAERGHAQESNIIYFSIVFLMGVLWIYQFLHGDLWGQFLVPYKWGSF